MNNTPHEPCSILMVDDTPKNLQVLGTILRAEGYHVEFSLNGEGALQWLDKQPFDLILLDVMMPEIDGFEVCRRIRSREEWDDIPIIFLTAKEDQTSVIQGFDLGAQDYIKKPFEARELLRRAHTHIELRRKKQAVSQMNEWLEAKVVARTAELNTALQRLETANTELLEIDKIKSDFLLMISQQLRSPLNSIKVPVEIMKHKAGTQELIGLVELLDKSVSELERFSLLALNFTQLKTGQRVLNKEEVALADLVEYSVMRHTANFRQKNLKAEIGHIVDTSIQADYDLLIDGLSFVITAAIQFAQNNSTITFSCSSQDAHCNMHISYMPVQQAQNTGEAIINSDIGLAYAKLIAEAHQGAITTQDDGRQMAIIISL